MKERKGTSARVSSAMRHLFELGKLKGGKCYGYTNSDINPAEADVVRRVYKRRAEGAGYYLIARELEKDDVLSPKGNKAWFPSQLRRILTNPRYNGVLVWGATKQTQKNGHRVRAATPDQAITLPDESQRIVPAALWKKVQAFNEQSRDAYAHTPNGKFKPRPIASRYLLTPFLRCGVCGGKMHGRKYGDRAHHPMYYFCTRRHLKGKAGCSNPRGLRMDLADKFALEAFEGMLVGPLMMGALEEFLAESKKVDPKPLRAEAKKLTTEIDRLVEALAKGDIKEIHDKVKVRKARLAALEQALQHSDVTAAFNPKKFMARVGPVLKGWREHLRSHPQKAQAVLRDLLPTIVATPKGNGAWSLSVYGDYDAWMSRIPGLEEVAAAVKAAMAKADRTGRLRA